jgi:dihydrofolate reductase
MIIGIVAVAKDLAIGKDGRLPWHYSNDLKFFKQTTTGNVVVMGSRTWRSIGKPLPGRLNIVLTRDAALRVPPGAMVVNDPQNVLELQAYLKTDIYVIGGARTYELFSPNIAKWIVTEVPVTVEGADTFMPGDFLDDFESVEHRDIGDALNVRTYIRKT